MISNLTTATAEAAKIDSPRVGSLLAAEVDSEAVIDALAAAIEDAREWSLNDELVGHANKLLHRLELSQDLKSEVAVLQNAMPIITQTDYLQFVLPVERLLDAIESNNRADAIGSTGGDRALQLLANEVIGRCQIEYWVSILTARLKNVTCATDANEHDMKKLKAAIQKGQALRASEEVLDASSLFLSRLEGELILSRAIASVPVVKLPTDSLGSDPAYFVPEEDIGHIKETEEYPAAPEGGYVWVHSNAFNSLLSAIEALKNGLHLSEGTGANVQVIADAKAKLLKAEKDMKLLDSKDQADKAVAVEAATKLAKKLKKGGKKK